MCTQSFSHVQFFVTLWTVACQAPLSMGFSRQEYWSGVPYPPPWALSNPGIEPMSSVYLPWICEFFITETPGKPVRAHSILSNSLRSHGLQHARPPCPSPTARACSKSCPLSRWFHSTISSSVVPNSSCLQSFPASRFFQWVSSLHQVAKVLEFQLQHYSFQWTFRVYFI